MAKIIDKSWTKMKNIQTDRDKMEKLFKYNMDAQYHQIIFLQKKQTFSSNVKQNIFAFIAVVVKNKLPGASAIYRIKFLVFFRFNI